MNIRKNLGKIAVSGLLIGSLVGCSNPEYHFDGMIGEDKVRFYERGMFKQDDYLEVIKPNGTKILYYKFNGTGGLQEVTIQKKDEEPITYCNRPGIGNPILEKALPQYKDYLRKIAEENIQKGLKDLD